MKIFYTLLLVILTHSYQYEIIDLEPYRYIYYVNDIIKSENNTIIYKFQPQSKKQDIYIYFLGDSKPDSFEFYLFSSISDIKYLDNNTFTNYIEKFENIDEIRFNHTLEIFYILIKMNSNENNYKYLSFMIYNIKEYMNIGKYNDYLLYFKGNKDIILNYPSKNISQYLYFQTNGRCDNITYNIYLNNTKSELNDSIINKCDSLHSFNLLFIENNNYYIEISIKSHNEIVRMELYYLDNDKDIKEIKNHLTDIKCGYSCRKDDYYEHPTYKYYFINIENVSLYGSIGYHVYEPFIKDNYKYSVNLKYYWNYNISELPKGKDIKNYDQIFYITYIENRPFIFFTKKKDADGLLLKIESVLNHCDIKSTYNELISYFYAKNIIDITENITLNYDQLLTKNTICFNSNKEFYLIMKSNLHYFNFIYPTIKTINSQSYLFDTRNEEGIYIELPIIKNALVEFQFVNKNKISKLNNPKLIFSCQNNTKEENYLYLPYMTNINILYGDIEIYDLNLTSLNSINDMYNEKYMEKYIYSKRYDNYSLLKEEQFFYKIKCNTNSLIKFEKAFNSYIEEKIIFNETNYKIFLDFSKNKRKIITFEKELPIYISIMNSSNLSENENWILNFSINNVNYSINYPNNSFFKEFKKSDILIIEKPNKNIHVYIKIIYNYDIDKFRPLTIKKSGIFVFEKNISEEYKALINKKSENGKYSLFYGNPKNFEFNQLFSDSIEIDNNPYKYIKNDDKDKLFFLFYDKYSDNDEFQIIKLRENNIRINKLNYIEKYDNEKMKLKFPKINDEKVILYIQYIYEKIDIFNESKKLTPEKSGKDFNIYLLNDNSEPYGENENFSPYKSFFFIRYINYSEYKEFKIIGNCNFAMTNIDVTSNKITIKIDNLCSSTKFNYYVFIDNNTNIIDNYNPIKLFYEKDSNITKYYEFKNKDNNIFEIEDSFKKGFMNITIVGQDTQEFNRFIYDNTKYEYKDEKKSYILIIIIASIVGLIIIAIIIICIIRYRRRKEMENELFGEEKTEILPNKKNNKKETKCLDFIDNEEEEKKY